MPRRNSDDGENCCGAFFGCICVLLVATIVLAGGGYFVVYVFLPWVNEVNYEMNNHAQNHINKFANDFANELKKHDINNLDDLEERLRLEFEARQRQH